MAKKKTTRKTTKRPATKARKPKAAKRTKRAKAHPTTKATSSKLAAAKRAVGDMERHLESLEKETREVRKFLRSAGAKKLGRKRPRKTKRTKR
jgi:hypothetical protein